ncbi:hypothetical protein [Nocardioides jiangxiensis]|uniref:DUF3291 domain-containing protein n=1 Tax=Nocardioides jiangxiensis TaxID=3064524 RepID=A0ABT9B4A8_9ACTN|nr:hypothetical protein [Nocardioides sp. WY-20]MDO7869557.1 hypothetical protein [Nocardioides sp. WY-20]
MTAELASHMTVRLAHFGQPRSIDEVDDAPPVTAHVYAAVGVNDPMASIGAAKEFTHAARISLHADLASATAAMHDSWGPTSWESGTHWAAVLEPFRHRGTVQWLNPKEPGPVFAVTDHHRPAGRCVVMTTAGWEMGADFDWSRAIEFTRRIDEVVSKLDTVPGLQYWRNLTFPMPSAGMTLSVWEDVKAMQTFAYQPGLHKPHMEYHWANPLGDYDSYTRFRIVDEVGTP